MFFFKQKTAYELRISDWSSDVCSSDLWMKLYRLLTGPDDTAFCARVEGLLNRGWQLHGSPSITSVEGRGHVAQAIVMDKAGPYPGFQPSRDRKSVVLGKSVSVRVDLGGRRIIKKKKDIKKNKKTKNH